MKKEFNTFYIVQKGDTIEKIAEKYQINATSILIRNNITPKMIKEGKVLYIKNN